MNPISFAVVGGGWRTEFFCRIAAMAPETYTCVGIYARRDEVARAISQRWGVRTVSSIEELTDLGAEFIISAVSWEAMPSVVTGLVEKGHTVLAETPPAPTADGLRELYDRVGEAKVQVAEQYMYMPGHAARKAVLDSGILGTARFVEVASTHMYHATSMIRSFLGTGLEPVRVTGRKVSAPLIDPLGFDGWTDSAPKPATTTIATLEWDGRAGLYQFTDNQWWNPILSRRILIRAELGEIVDDTVTRMVDGSPVTSRLEYRRTGVDMNLEGNDLDHVSFDGQVIYTNPWKATRMSEDDIGVASFLLAMGQWVRGNGPEPYPLAEACYDHLIALAIEESAITRRDVTASWRSS